MIFFFKNPFTKPILLYIIIKHMAVVVKWLTQRIVAPSCARSTRVSRPIVEINRWKHLFFFFFYLIDDREGEA